MLESQISAKLTSFVRVRQGGIRSINVERDVQQAALADEYVLTAQACATLSRILDGTGVISPTRTWTLTGPYGSGKSYFGLFLMNLMCVSLPAHSHALAQLRQADPRLTERVLEFIHPNGSRGLLPIPITGFRSSLQMCLKHGFQQALQPLACNDQIHSLLSEDVWTSSTDSHKLLQWVERLLWLITQPDAGYTGIVLILDEMGKLLEYTAANPDSTDIYLLQELAEFANRNRETAFFFVGILHQAFERYAGNLDTTTQLEWAKVQGRFEDCAFQEPPDQQMRLLANALELGDQGLPPAVIESTKRYAAEAIENGWNPALMATEEFTDLCVRAYPLHPTALVALPYVFRRLAQNERSLFAYLASSEPFGFQEFLQQQTPPTDIRLANLFDYLAANFQGRLYSSLRARPLTETLERLSNFADLDPLAMDVLKTIGVLNWLAEVSPLQASQARLYFALNAPDRSESQIQEAMRGLQSRSLVTYRRFNQTYGIWQGSDVDIEERMQEARQRLSSTFSLAETVQQFLSPRPLVARRHSYQTGTVRYFEVYYVDGQTHDQLSLEPSDGASGIVLLCLPANHAETEDFTRWAKASLAEQRPDLVVCIIKRTARMVELMNELRCLHWVKDNTPDLRDDPVARRELRTRVNMLTTLVQNELDRTLSTDQLSNAAGCGWFYRGEDVSTDARRSLSHLLSMVCDSLYPHSPRVWNELINRRTLSSQGAAARRNLIEAMLRQAAQPRLGITGYPPERSMYESLLHVSGLHRPVGPAYWEFFDPSDEDPLRLRPLWQAIADYVFATSPEPRGVQELFGQLTGAPYGLTAGVAPVLLCAFLIVQRDETTLYQEGSLLPEPDIADWEVLLRRPELFAVAGCRVTGSRTAVVERLARGFHVAPATMPVVRELIRRLKGLPEHAWRTQRLSDSALAVRRAIEGARSPERLLFLELPAALGCPSFAEDDVDLGQVEAFFDVLNRVLTELNSATPRLLIRARDSLLSAFGLPLGEEGWQHFRKLAGELEPQVTQPSLLPLLRRVAGATDTRAALDSALAYVADRPLRSWSDADAERFGRQAQALGKLFRAERNGGHAHASLTPIQETRSVQVADRLRGYLRAEFTDDPGIVAAALQVLLNEYRRQK